MAIDKDHPLSRPLAVHHITLLALVAVAAFHLAYWKKSAAGTALYLGCLWILALRWEGNLRDILIGGLTIGLAICVPPLEFLFPMFGINAIPLWVALALWTAIFLAVCRVSVRRLGAGWTAFALPFIWLGLEYLRCEAGPARFPWLTPPFAFSAEPGVDLLVAAGVYGFSFVTLLVFSSSFIAIARPGFVFILFLAVLGVEIYEATLFKTSPEPPLKVLRVAGLQLERRRSADVELGLERIAAKHPEAELLVLGEYTFDGPVPEEIRAWCAKNRRFLLAGGREPAPGGGYYNTAYVVNARGEIAFKQAKIVPLPLLKDGLPGSALDVWESPWGKLGICVGYDLGFARVTDQLVREGALALIAPTMDATNWGEAEHDLHSRVASLRAAEYGLPVFRLATSGISEIVDSRGRVVARGSTPGPGEIVQGTLELRGPGRVPVDRFLAMAGIFVLGFVLLRVALMAFKDWWHNRALPKRRLVI